MTQLEQLGREQALDIYRTMVRIEATDKRIQMGLQAGDLQFQYYPAGGQEAIAASLASQIEADDYSVTTYRVVHDIVAKGTPISEIIAEMYGKETGTSKGKGGPMHLTDPKSGLMLTTGIVGAGAPIANGIALAAQFKKTGRVTLCSFGDGAANIGAVHEALNMAALWSLPVIFVCQNNSYAEYTDFKDSTKSDTIAGRAGGYGMVGERVDGRDPVALVEAARRAVDRARAGDGPTLLECMAPRLQGHAFGSDLAHMDQARLKDDKANAPVATVRQRLLDEGLANEDDLAKIEAEAKVEVDKAQDFANESQSPAAAELYSEILDNPDELPEGPGKGGNSSAPEPTPPETQKMTFGQAVTDALDTALSTDEDVFLLGEDIQDPNGGIVKATVGLSSKHGLDRVRPTPISEQAIVGAAIGSAMMGMKPVAEIMVCDFALVCMDQIANHAAKLRYMSGGRTTVPLTIRMLTAGNVGSFGAQHSQSLESMFAHMPGLKIVAPSNAFDAKGLLLSCIHDPDPCISIEAMRCFFVPGDVGVGDYRVPLGKAAIRQAGTDVTLISYSWGMQEVMGAAATLSEDGISAEVIDLRSIIPLDLNTVLESVSKTGRVVIVHPAVEFCGFGAELSSKIHEHAFADLKAPVARLGARYTPIPFNQQLEAMHFPTAPGVTEKVRAMFGKA